MNNSILFLLINICLVLVELEVSMYTTEVYLTVCDLSPHEFTQPRSIHTKIQDSDFSNTYFHVLRSYYYFAD